MSVITERPDIFPFQGDQVIQRWVNCFSFISVWLVYIPWDISVHFHNVKFRLLLPCLFILGCFKMFQLTMGQHHHNVVSHADFHLALTLLNLYCTNTIPWSSWADDKVESHVSWNLFKNGNTILNDLRSSKSVKCVSGGHAARWGCGICAWVLRGNDMAVIVWWIVGRQYTAVTMAEDFFNFFFLHIERGWIITTIPVYKQ